ncbi:hypothetical protein [Cesiribacter sp. SM1]|uniref:hypothetical protein n=1 Tax=Cesiribacter sp. SM1 TaxID=2861196 RepID=UPI001CD389B7|nr:hypothetical protein [Cesiribacter sp. SM1]
MAEIRVEPKRKAPIWPWIVGILILLGLIWLLAEAFDRDDDEYENDRIEDDRGIENDTVGSVSTDEEGGKLVLNISRPLDSESEVAA